MRRRQQQIAGGVVGVIVVISGGIGFFHHLHRTAAPASDRLVPLLNLGKSQYEQRQFEAAATTFTQAAAMRPDSLDAQLDLANALLAGNKPEQAIAPAQAALKIDPASPAGFFLLGSAELRLAHYEEALKALQQSEQIDSRIAAVHFLIGLAHRGLEHLEDAASEFKEAIDLEPEHPAAHYALGQALMQLGRRKEAGRELEKHAQIAAKIAGTAGGNLAVDSATFEKCVYTRARVPFELAEQPEAAGITVSFLDATVAAFGPGASQFRGPIGIIDVAHDGHPGLLVAGRDGGFHYLRNNHGVFTATGNLIPATGGPWRQIVAGDLGTAGDLQKIGVPGAVALGETGCAVFTFNSAGAATDVTAASGLETVRAGGGVLADFDFTGHLGLYVTPPDGAGIHIWRNQGNFSFKAIADNNGIPANLSGIRSLLVEDWNSDDLPDLFVGRAAQKPLLLANQRGGTLTDAASPGDWAAAGPAGAMAAGDLDNDLRTDLAIAREGQIEIAFGPSSRHLTLPTGAFNVASLCLIDYDNDGWLDLVAAGDKGLRIWRNLGRGGFREVTAELGLDKVVTASVASVQSGNFNADGSPDLLLTMQDGSIRLLQNQGGNTNRSISIALKGKRSNPSGLGSRIEITADGWRTIREYVSNPLLIGVGKHSKLDRLTVHWFDLSVSTADLPVGPPGTPLTIEELQLPTGSCPNLYVWDGLQYRYVGDILGSAPMGLPIADHHLIDADADELVFIGDESIVAARHGAYELQIIDELREVTYLDEAKLVVVDHSADTEIVSTSKLLPRGPFPPARLMTLGNRRPLLGAIRNDGLKLTDALRETDGKYASPPRPRAPQYRGLAEPWSVTLDFGPLAENRPLTLALTGWLRFGGGMANIAASRNPDFPFPFPTLEAQTEDGVWHQVDVVFGAPSGKNKTIMVDLSGRLPHRARQLRISTAFEIHWDRIALFEQLDASSAVANAGTSDSLTNPGRSEYWLSPVDANLHWHGFGIYEDHPWYVPLTPMHDRVVQSPPWRITPSGWCTRYGEVTELLEQKDNALVLLGSGDEVTLRFAADRLPQKPAGFHRDFFLFISGWDKDSDYHVVRGDTIDPLPFHGMDDQQYGKQSPPTNGQRWIAKYNTRWVGPLALPRNAPSR